MNLRGLCGSKALNFWVTRSIMAEMYPDVSNGEGTWVAWLDGEMSGYRAEEWKSWWKDQRVKMHRCVCVWGGHAWIYIFMSINNNLLILVSGNFLQPYTSIIFPWSHICFLPHNRFFSFCSKKQINLGPVCCFMPAALLIKMWFIIKCTEGHCKHAYLGEQYRDWIYFWRGLEHNFCPKCRFLDQYGSPPWVALGGGKAQALQGGK